MEKTDDNKKPADEDISGLSIKEIQERVHSRVNEEWKDTQPEEAKDKINSGFVMQCLDANESGDGALLTARESGRLVFDPTLPCWVVWKEHSWIDDIEFEAFKAVEGSVVSSYLTELARVDQLHFEAIKQGDKERRSSLEGLQKKLSRRIDKLRSVSGALHCLEFAKAQLVTGQEFDSDPWLFGCVNGVVELKTGKFRPGRPEDFIKKISPVKWLGIEEMCPAFEKFILEIMNEDSEKVSFLQRYFGYCITGCNHENKFVVLWGRGRNGKSVLIEIIKSILGEHAQPLPSEMFLQSKYTKNPSGPSPELMTLKGIRFAYAAETDDGRHFSASQVKWLSGGDSITARAPHAVRSSTWTPTHKLCLLTNHRPSADASDFAFFERLILVSFALSFVDRQPLNDKERMADKTLFARLKGEASGILAWLVRGCLEYQRQGLNPPRSVLEAGTDYKNDEDQIGEFVSERCERGDGLKVQSRPLYDAFADWYKSNVSEKNIMSPHRFGKILKERFDRVNEAGKKWYKGVNLKLDL